MNEIRRVTPVVATWRLLEAALGAGSAALGAPETTSALARVDRLLDALAQALRVEFYGPEVGLGGGRAVYRLVVREHALGPTERQWGVRICTALPHAGWRADWTLAAAGRKRRHAVIAVLPAFFAGYAAAVTAADHHTTKAGQRLEELARAFVPTRAGTQ